MESSNVNKFAAEFLRLQKIDYWQVLETDCAIETHLEAENAAKHFLECGGDQELKMEVYECVLDELRASKIQVMTEELERLKACIKERDEELSRALAAIGARKVIVMEREFLKALERVKKDRQYLEQCQSTLCAGESKEKSAESLRTAKKKETLLIDVIDWPLSKHSETVV